ncbi:MAG: hypothetical protein IJS28_05215 [Synergistaceae bacterium]|nr:hypothetical protein [Synergistaceae bacterium]
MTAKRTAKPPKERIDQLLNMAWNTKSTARTLAIVNQILEISPGNVDALVMKADNIQDADERAGILLRALQALTFSGGDYDPEDRDILLYVVNQRLAYTYFYANKFDEALRFCEAALKSGAVHDDPDAEASEEGMKSLHYRLLIERGDWQKIIAETMRDEEHSWAWGYSRMIAAWMLGSDNTRRVCASMFWDVLAMSPDIPFYMLGYFAEPDDGASQRSHDEFDFALLYYDALSVSDDFFNWFTRGTILFGLLSGRFEEREREYLLDVLDTLGGYEEYERMSGLIVEGEDEAVIEMLAANKCLAE